MNALKINADCRWYKTDRPCLPHKRYGYVCAGCPAYDPIAQRVLIVKLDATGDVLRTTSLLRPLHAAMPACHVTWITLPGAVEVLRPNKLIEEVIPLGVEALLLLQTQQFDVVINPDASITSSRLATLARAPDKRGFVVDELGRLVPLNDEARRWYEMGLNDDLKKTNQRTYQSILLAIAELPATEHPIIWEVTKAEAEFAASFARRANIAPGQQLIIGLNTGAGGRWRWKKWTEEGYIELISTITRAYPDAHVLLYGGPEERQRNEELARQAPGHLTDTGTHNTLREFGALIDLCDVLVTGDTMAMHMALALGKQVVALFGPTSAPEIELYDHGTKIVPRDMPCLGCYLWDCDIRPACMERITTEQVMTALMKHVAALSNAVTTEASRRTSDCA